MAFCGGAAGCGHQEQGVQTEGPHLHTSSSCGGVFDNGASAQFRQGPQNRNLMSGLLVSRLFSLVCDIQHLDAGCRELSVLLD